MKMEEILKATQEELFKMLCKKFEGSCCFCKGGFIMVKGSAPVMLVAHLDTVHAETVKTICRSEDGNILMSPEGIGGDDRCGVFALTKIFEKSEEKPYLLFTCDEETGGEGAQYFCKIHSENKLPSELDKLKMIVEIDRRGSCDAVFYDCDNQDFEKYVTSKGFVKAQGSFSDICYIAPELGSAAVNLSSGYYNAHTQHEYINLQELQATVEKVLEMVKDSTAKDFPHFDFVEKIFYGLDRFNDFEEFGDWDEEIYLSPENEELYIELADIYDVDELDNLILIHGENILKELYKSCYDGWDSKN